MSLSISTDKIYRDRKYQKTISSSVLLEGVGLHSGLITSAKINPAPENYGIVFRRTDVKGFDNIVSAKYNNVTNTQLGTTISNEQGTLISTVEHLMAALWGCGIDNALIDLTSSEIPIMDGSSAVFAKAILEKGITVQNDNREYLKILKRVEVKDGDKFSIAEESDDFSIDLEIDFSSKIIARQQKVFSERDNDFVEVIADSRTFGFQHEVDYLRSQGLARGGSLDNAIVLGKDGVLNKGGLRHQDEFVRHKILDCIGDFYLAGTRLLTDIKSYKSGHGINNKLLHEIFADKSCYERVTVPSSI